MRPLLLGACRTIFFVFLLDALLRLVPGGWPRRFLRAGLLTVSGVLFFLDASALALYRVVLDKAMLRILLATNPREASEFFGMYAGSFSYLSAMTALALCLGVLYFALRRLVRSPKGLFLCLLVGGAASFQFARHAPVYLSVPRFAVMASEALREKRAYDAMAASIESRTTALTRNESDISFVVFVLGESTSRNHMSLYGYPLPTTPRLEARRDEGGLFVFRDAVSPHSHTMPVLEKLFTFYRRASPPPWHSYANLFDIARAAGYRTEWLSNQESSGVWGYAANLYADRCDAARYAVIRDSKTQLSGAYDEALLPFLDEALAHAAEKNLYVLHLMGTHGGYAYRYPPAFRVFSERDETQGDDARQKRTRAEYDNAVLYNDFILDEIIRRFEARDAVVIYVSDHAEEVYEEAGRPSCGHDEIHGTRHMIEVPLLVWASPSFRARRPALARRIAGSTERPFMTDDMIHVLLDLMAVETADYDPAKSLVNESFDAARARVYAGKLYQNGKLEEMAHEKE